MVLAGFSYGVTVSAERFTSPSYTIDASVVGNSFGGDASSTSYKLTSSGGESVIGQGSGGSYKLDAGYVSQLTGSASSFSLTVQPSGLIGYYSFDNVTAGQTDVANDAGVTSRPIVTQDSSLDVTTGKINSAAVFNGTSTFLDDKKDTSSEGYYVVPPNGSLSMEGWFKTSANTQQSLLWNNYGCVGWDVRINWVGQLASEYVGGTGCGDVTYADEVLSPSNVVDGQWRHYAVTIDRSVGVMKLYLDGSLVDTQTGIDQTSTQPWWQQMRIGTIWNNTQFFNGHMDEVKIFNRTLSEAEIKAEYDAQNVGTPSGLSLGTIVPNTPNTTLFDNIVQTTASGYTLAIHQNADLTASGGATIPAITPTIASPASWSDGTTKGLGFTLASTNATALDGKWSSGASYARLPTSTATTFYNRSGTPSAKDIVTARLRADVTSSQAVGQYNNVVTVTGTYTP